MLHADVLRFEVTSMMTSYQWAIPAARLHEANGNGPDSPARVVHVFLFFQSGGRLFRFQGTPSGTIPFWGCPFGGSFVALSAEVTFLPVFGMFALNQAFGCGACCLRLGEKRKKNTLFM